MAVSRCSLSADNLYDPAITQRTGNWLLFHVVFSYHKTVLHTTEATENCVAFATPQNPSLVSSHVWDCVRRSIDFVKARFV